MQYEGLEQSPNIVYTGAAPNQQIIPAVKWAFDHLGCRFFLVGSDYVFPHAAHAIMKDRIRALRGEVVGEHYILLGSTDVEAAVEAIAASKPDVILNTLDGDRNVAFFKALRARHYDLYRYIAKSAYASCRPTRPRRRPKAVFREADALLYAA